MRRLVLALALLAVLAGLPVGASAAPADQGYFYSWNYSYQYPTYTTYVATYNPFPVSFPRYGSVYEAITPYGYFARYNSPCTYVGWLAYGSWGC